jgi:hypothetical protein
LHQRDPRVGLLEKTGGAQVRNRAVDIMLYDLGNGTAQVVDVIADGEGHDGTPRPSWGLADIRPISQWRAPYPVASQPAPQPQPTPGTPPAQPAPVDLAPILARIDAQAAVIADTNAALLRLAEVIEKLRIPAASSLTDLHGTVTIPYLGTGRVDLVAGKRPQKEQ